MIAQDVQDYLQSLACDWIYPENTVDTFKAGDPVTPLRGMAVAWMSYTWAIERALELDCNVFITHEPTYYNHWDNDDDIFRFRQIRAKRQFIKESGLVIIRCHDLWDQIKDIGIPDSWGRLLQLGQAIDGDAYTRVYEVGPTTAAAIAEHIAGCTAPFGQPGVQLIGRREKIVRRICIGTGAITPYLDCVEKYQVDLAICSDDGIDYWRDGGFAIDMDIPIVVVNHPVSEEIGVMSLAENLSQRFPSIPVHHIRQRCMYELVTQAE